MSLSRYDKYSCQRVPIVTNLAKVALDKRAGV
jgi:hypothetical protein